jgi:dipeptidyl-peptidase-4
MPLPRPLPLALAALVLAGAPALAQPRPLTLDDLYDPEKKLDFTGQPPSGFEWVSDTHYVWPKTDPKTRQAEWLRVEAATGRTEPLLDAARLEAALAKLPGVSGDEAKRLARPRSPAWNAARTAVVLEVSADLYLYETGPGRIVRLTFAAGREEEASFSPDGTLVAFVRANDLFLVDVATQRERAVTSDGSEDVLNGRLDWVYEEEVYGRGRRRAYWWSPDSGRLAFLRLDEHAVPRYTLVDDTSTRPTVETWPYPKAGDPNPTVRLGVASVAGGAPRFLDLDRYAPDEILIVNVAWTPDSKQVVLQVQDREQTWLDLDLAPAASGAVKTLFRETTKAFVDPHTSEGGLGPLWLADGGFLWLSERTGFAHLHRYKADGTLVRALTSGRWEVTDVHGVDEAKGLVYFAAAERSPIAPDLYRVGLDGTGFTRLSQRPGSHRAAWNPGFSLFLDSWSDLTTPTQVRLHAADGAERRLVHEGKVEALARFRLATPELLKVRTRDGFEMEAMLLKPPDFDPARKYPVYQQTYAGPHAPQVRNAWGGTGTMYHQLLAQKGIVVWVCDNRSASGKGIEPTWHAYQRMGESELADIEDGLAWLRQQPWVDAARIGINGWSYGGFMVSYALTHSKSFAMGIAGAPVTDWRNYDSIYTERYMRMPQRNPEGYARTSAKAAARDLHGELLLVHGTIDDNVHPQNTLQLAQELQKAGKPFRLMLYPKSRHGVADPALVKHMRAMMLAFVEETLLGPKRSGAAAATQP